MFIESNKKNIIYSLKDRIPNAKKTLYQISLYSLKQNKNKFNFNHINKFNEYASTNTINNELKLPILIKDYDIFRIYENKTRIKSQNKINQIKLRKNHRNNNSDVFINGKSILNTSNSINNTINIENHKNNDFYMHNILQKFLFKDKFINKRLKNLDEKNNNYSYNFKIRNINSNKKFKLPLFHNEELLNILKTKNE